MEKSMFQAKAKEVEKALRKAEKLINEMAECTDIPSDISHASLLNEAVVLHETATLFSKLS